MHLNKHVNNANVELPSSPFPEQLDMLIVMFWKGTLQWNHCKTIKKTKKKQYGLIKYNLWEAFAFINVLQRHFH